MRYRAEIDRLLVVLSSPVTVPCAALVAIVVRIVDGPPALVRLPRMGANHEPFEMVKVRSMRPPKAGDSPIALGGDDRITKVGRWLRRSHIDELPQLLHVLAGQMSLLGPRPETASLVERSDSWDRVLAARPGIAGPTQVIIRQWEDRLGPDGLETYRSEILPVKLAIDAWYVESATPALDLRTLQALFQLSRRAGAQTELHRIVRRNVPQLAVLEDSSRLGPASLNSDERPAPLLEPTTDSATDQDAPEVSPEHGKP